MNFAKAFITTIADDVPNDCLKLVYEKLCMFSTAFNIEPIGEQLQIKDNFIPDCYKAYLVTRKIEGLSDNTLRLYNGYLLKFFNTVQKPIELITANDIRLFLFTYQREGKCSNRTLDTIRTIIGTFFEWTAIEGHIGYNPARNIKPIKYQEKPREALSQYELEQIRLSCTTLRDRAMIEFLFSTGCRVSELANLNRFDVNIDDCTVTLLGKGDKYRTGYLSPCCKLTLQNYLASRDDDNDALFVTERAPHTRITKNGIERAVARIGDKSGIGRHLHPHILRHTTATMALAKNMDAAYIQQLLGHSNIATTMIYAKVNTGILRAEHSRCIA